MQTLIIEAGGTKSAFAVVGNGQLLAQCTATGINPNYSTNEEIRQCLCTFRSQYQSCHEIRKVVYYGAGCASIENQKRMQDLLASFFITADIVVHSDLLAVCHALCHGQRAIAGILGTGAATCLYDGNQLVSRAPSLGYMLGDEGSGTNLGKRLLIAYLNGTLPAELKEAIEEQYGLTFQDTIHKIYSEPHPNQLMSSLAPFVSDHLEHPFLQQLAHDAFSAFFFNQRQYYPEADTLQWHIAGSVAFFYEPFIRKAASEADCHVGTIIRAPMERLIEIHKIRTKSS